MNIFLFVDKYLPNPLSCAKLMFDLATEIKSVGHKPFIFTIDNNLTSKKSIENEKGISVIRTLGSKTKTSNKVLRTYAELTMSYKILKHNSNFINQTKCDYLIIYSPSIFWVKLIKKIKKINNCKSYLILRDLFPQWLVDTGIINKNGIINHFFSFKEKQLYDQCDIIGVQSPSNLDHFNSSSLKNSYNLEVLYNWTKINKNKSLRKTAIFRELHNLTDKTIFVYAGNIGFAQDLTNIIRLAKNVRKIKKIHFLIIGDGTEKGKIRNDIRKLDLNNITLLSSVDELSLMNILVECDVGIISLSKKLKTENIPGKLLSYCQASLPIIASINKSRDLRRMIIDSNSGLVSENGNDEKFLKNVIKLFDNPKIINEYGVNANKLMNGYFDVKVIANQILGHYKKKNAYIK